jgi:dipeptidyl-peptidase-4
MPGHPDAAFALRRWTRPDRITSAAVALLTLAAVACAQPARAPTPAGAPTPPTPPAIPEHLRTVAERTGFASTARYAETVALLDALADAAPDRARRASMGTSGEQREIPLLILSDPPVRSAEEAHALADRTGKLIVLAIGNIHAGEPDGAEALPMLARDIALPLGPDRALLDRLIIVLAPLYNPDGTERPGNHRPTQNGPATHGTRENAAGLDLNRDFIKAETPEGSALLRFFREWDPHLFIDCHVTNGSLHRYVISYAGIKNPAGDAALLDFSRDRFLPGVDALYEAATGQPTFYYGSFGSAFSEEPTDRSRWGTFPAQARFGTNYVGLRNRLGLLVESYTYAPFQQRVELTREYVRHALRWSAQHAGDIRAVTAAADARAAAPSDTPRTLPVRTKAAPFPDKVTILGYEERLENGRPVSTGQTKDYTVEFWDRWEPEISVSVPVAYAIPAIPPIASAEPDPIKVQARERLIDKLRQHGVALETLTQPRRVLVEPSVFAKLEPASRAFQGHVLVRVGLAPPPAASASSPSSPPAREPRELPPGTVLIPTAQRLGALAVYLLEPEGEDSLATWNYLDPWLHVGTESPVWRVVGQ